jgi:N-acyl-D-aspartate/D-glutamate deacylase
VARFDTAIRGGILVDGRRMPRVRADVGIKDGRIAEIGGLRASDADRVLDASGMVVAPGFVDLHTHYDAQIFWDPYCTMAGWHGVTSLVACNCGFGFAPMREEDRERAMLSMTRVESIPLAAMKVALPWTWESFPEMLAAIAALPKAVNFGALLPLCPLLTYVLGAERAKAGVLPTDAEHAELRRLLREAMEAGASGWSAQRMEEGSGADQQKDFDGSPMVSDVMHKETCYELAQELGAFSRGFIQLTPACKGGGTTAFCEEVAKAARRPLLFNAVIAFQHYPEVHKKQLRWLEGCRKRGLPIYGQGFTTDAGHTFSFEDWNLYDEMPAWREATTGSVAERLAKLSDPKRRPALRDSKPYLSGAFEDIVVAEGFSPETQRWRDWQVRDVAEQLGKHPVDALLDLACADGLETVFFSVSPTDTRGGYREVMTDPSVLPGVSDGGAHVRFLTAGRYPTETIIRAAREGDVMSLEDVHAKLSALPAYVAGYRDRGTIEVGKAADIVVYDFENLEVLPVEKLDDQPGGEWRRVQRAKGYRYILVNGEVTIEEDRELGRHPGRMLR